MSAQSSLKIPLYLVYQIDGAVINSTEKLEALLQTL